MKQDWKSEVNKFLAGKSSHKTVQEFLEDIFADTSTQENSNKLEGNSQQGLGKKNRTKRPFSAQVVLDSEEDNLIEVLKYLLVELKKNYQFFSTDSNWLEAIKKIAIQVSTELASFAFNEKYQGLFQEFSQFATQSSLPPKQLVEQKNERERQSIENEMRELLRQITGSTFEPTSLKQKWYKNDHNAFLQKFKWLAVDQKIKLLAENPSFLIAALQRFGVEFCISLIDDLNNNFPYAGAQQDLQNGICNVFSHANTDGKNFLMLAMEKSDDKKALMNTCLSLLSKVDLEHSQPLFEQTDPKGANILAYFVDWARADAKDRHYYYLVRDIFHKYSKDKIDGVSKFLILLKNQGFRKAVTLHASSIRSITHTLVSLTESFDDYPLFINYMIKCALGHEVPGRTRVICAEFICSKEQYFNESGLSNGDANSMFESYIGSIKFFLNGVIIANGDRNIPQQLWTTFANRFKACPDALVQAIVFQLIPEEVVQQDFCRAYQMKVYDFLNGMLDRSQELLKKTGGTTADALQQFKDCENIFASVIDEDAYLNKFFRDGQEATVCAAMSNLIAGKTYIELIKERFITIYEKARQKFGDHFPVYKRYHPEAEDIVKGDIALEQVLKFRTPENQKKVYLHLDKMLNDVASFLKGSVSLETFKAYEASFDSVFAKNAYLNEFLKNTSGSEAVLPSILPGKFYTQKSYIEMLKDKFLENYRKVQQLFPGEKFPVYSACSLERSSKALSNTSESGLILPPPRFGANEDEDL